MSPYDCGKGMFLREDFSMKVEREIGDAGRSRHGNFGRSRPLDGGAIACHGFVSNAIRYRREPQKKGSLT